MINSNKMVEARRYVADNLPNNDFDQVLDWFNSGKIPKGKITATRSGERTLDQSVLTLTMTVQLMLLTSDLK